MAKDGNHTAVRWEIHLAAVEDLFEEKHLQSVSTTMGCFVLIFSTFLGTIANLLALKHFIAKKNVFFNAFKMVALSDILICLLSTFYGISLIAGRAPLLFSNIHFCWGWSIFWKILVRFSLHLVAIQSTFRTIKICQPFRALNNIILAVVASFDLLIIIGVTVFSSRVLFMPFYTKTFASCLGREIRQTVDSSRFLFLIWLCNSVLPFPVILTCCVLCLIKLVRRNRAAVKKFGKQLLSRDISYSIVSLLVFSLTGFAFNLVSLAPFSRNPFFQEIDEGASKRINIWFLLYGNVIFRELLITLNSILNPFIFFWRMAELRGNILSTVIRPIYFILTRYCEGTAQQAQTGFDIELEDMEANNFQTPNTLQGQGAHQDDLLYNGIPPIITDDLPKLNDDALSNSITSYHEASENLGTRNKKVSLILDSKLGSIGTVIVHKNAINFGEREFHSNVSAPREDNESSECQCQCECCYLESNDARNYNIHEWASQKTVIDGIIL